jgi:hypothetical protein
MAVFPLIALALAQLLPARPPSVGARRGDEELRTGYARAGKRVPAT